MPLFYPTLFITWTLRASSHAANSITNALNALKALCAWEASRGMDLESAFTHGVLLDHNQIRDLCDFLQRSLEREQPAKVTPIHHRPKVVGTTVHYFRISTAAHYLQFLARRVAPHLADEVITKMIETIKAHRPSKPNKSSMDRDEIHLSDEAINAIEAALKPGSPDNPANDVDVQLRNALMFFVLKLTGMRRGELLNLRISDINFADNTLAVLRRPDSSLDTRKHQPTAKTRSRRIRIAPALVERIANYVKDVRRNVPGARRHDYLFVTHKAGPTQGAPLSIGAFSKWMGQISDIAENAGFHAHALRHNWNYQFSRLAEEKGMSPEEEEKIRSYWMGWSETSGTAGTYNRRHTKEKAQQAGLELQERYVKSNQESE
ncbi:tyrosine-type recombinase/integrase [Pseudomonas sichuanensis]|uniref:tyrosine-type recombinase/integrase n=1 Tax=Pseudomonas sichuanensis TaxID=2213015 RepID=UPI00244D3772|nr:tyrosine-type recombinase/integrase [Pseudomonas sichuanensis]MDH0731986.1 tyrosine-type recombinase/integrase [Pseudomonas sichuanensis]MDH1584271.1 tyrosine-type recombinase/integrase [Pseudomonas sichuanensis]MDH1593331.1 tyrosine-type recombinase/integrase [Pseudomonas sichuanensis]MDH1599016.1 tyrosine-type recombinase/integrase [Pseudomonas sichuanensis]